MGLFIVLIFKEERRGALKLAPLFFVPLLTLEQNGILTFLGISCLDLMINACTVYQLMERCSGVLQLMDKCTQVLSLLN